MADNYDDVCSCCGGQAIDPGYYICEKCRRKMRVLRDRERNKDENSNTNEKVEVENGNVS